MSIWRTRSHTTTLDPSHAANETVGSTNGMSTDLAQHPAVDGPHEWLFPGSDEYYRSLYTLVATERPVVLAVTSATSGEGKTTTALGLAITTAQDFPNQRVLLVEADLSGAVLAGDFGVDPSPGLADCLVEEHPVMRAYRSTFLSNLHLVPAGIPDRADGRLLRSPLMAAAVEIMKRTYDVVILDCPSILVDSDAVALTDLADGTIFIVRSGVTPTQLVDRALERVHESKLRGIVLNGATSAVPGWISRLCGL